MRKNVKVSALAVLSVLAVSSLGSCGNKDSGVGVYTLRDSVSASPDTWNVHTWQTNVDAIIMGYTEMGLYDFVLNDEKNGYDIICEMAADDPRDVTSSLTDEEVSKYGLNKNSDGNKYTSGQKWEIDLNQAACWADGTPINADTYIESMDRMLDPNMANSRASSYYNGQLALGNADGRFKSGKTVYESIINSDAANVHTGDRADSNYYGSLYDTPAWIGYSVSTLVDSYSSYIPKAVALMADTSTWGTSSDKKYVDFSSNSTAKGAYLDAWLEILTNLFGVSMIEGDRPVDDNNIYEQDLYFGKYNNKEVAFDNVGIKKTGEYQITLYLLNPTSEFYMHYNLAGNWIVKTDLYDANKTTVGSLTSTTYGTSMDNYMGYGPYKLSSYVLDKEIKLERNEKWYGWSDGKHDGQFQTTNIDIQVVPEENTVLSMFEKGQLDSYALRSEDVAKYGSSSSILYTPQSYTDKIALNSNFDSLKERQAADSNKTILSNLNFRKGLCWGLDRQTYVQTQTAGSAPATYFINSMYVADPETGLSYRNTDAAKKVVTDFFGDSETGFDLDKAREFITKACEEENASTADGSWKNGQKVVLDWGVFNEGWGTAIQDVIEDFKEACVGTPLEGLLDVKITYDTDYQDKMRFGKYDIAMDIWGGSEMNPYEIPETWISDDYRSAYGFDPYTEKFTLNINGEDVTMTNYEWYQALNKGAYSSANASVEVRVQVLAGLEAYVMHNCYYLPQRARQSLSMASYKVSYATDEYVQLVGFGGIRKMTYNYDDHDWEAIVNAGLDYTK